MATRGRPVIPLEQKRLRGTLRPDRLPPNAPLIGLVSPLEPLEPPQGLSDTGLAFWGLAWESGWISERSDYVLVVMASQALSERDTLRALVDLDPLDYRARSGLRDLERQLVSQLSLLGFSPSDRSRLGLAEVKKESKLETLLAKQREHRAKHFPNL